MHSSQEKAENHPLSFGGNMELSWLETFIALAETGSVRGAAARLGISPATTSERISSLEDDLGIRLLERTSRGSELTGAGRLYLQSAYKILENWDNLKSLVKPLEDSPHQRLSIGIHDHGMFPYLGRFLDSFMAEYPYIELSISAIRKPGSKTASAAC